MTKAQRMFRHPSSFIDHLIYRDKLNTLSRHTSMNSFFARSILNFFRIQSRKVFRLNAIKRIYLSPQILMFNTRSTSSIENLLSKYSFIPFTKSPICHLHIGISLSSHSNMSVTYRIRKFSQLPLKYVSHIYDHASYLALTQILEVASLLDILVHPKIFDQTIKSKILVTRHQHP